MSYYGKSSEDYHLEQMPMFVGMTLDEIHEWIEKSIERGHKEWAREEQERLLRERQYDAAYLKEAGDKNVVPGPDVPVKVDECVRVDHTLIQNDWFITKNDLVNCINFVKLSTTPDKKMYFQGNHLSHLIR